MSARLVIVESPYAGNVQRNVAYARLACWWCLKQGLAPFASHLIYTQCLDDRDPVERELGMGAGMAYRRVAEMTIAFIDFGMSSGMKAGVTHARKYEQEVHEVSLEKELGVAGFADAMVRFESAAHLPTVDHPVGAGPPRCMTCNVPVRFETVGRSYRCTVGCTRDGLKGYGESVVERARPSREALAAIVHVGNRTDDEEPTKLTIEDLEADHKPQIGGA